MNKFLAKSALIYSAKWGVFATVIRQISQIAVFIILARNLNPDDFAIAGVALAVVLFFSLVSQAGFAAAIVGSKHLDKKYLDSIFTFQIIVGVICYVFLIAISNYLDEFYKPMRLSNIIEITGLSIIINISASVPNALLQRKLDFHGLAFISVTAALVQLLFVWYFVNAGLGVWAIVFPPVIGGAISSFLSYLRSGYRPSLAFDSESIKESLPYGITSFNSQLLNFFSSNSIVLVMGRFWSEITLGHYVFVDSKVLKPFELISVSFFTNLYPILTRVSDDIERMGVIYVKITRLVGYTIIPIYITLISIIPDLVPVLFGGTWEPTVQLFQILMLVGIFRSIGFGANCVHYALGRPKIVWHIGMIRALGYCLIIFFALLLNLDAKLVAICVVFVEAVVGAFNLLFVLKPLGIKLIIYLRIIRLDFFLFFIFIIFIEIFVALVDLNFTDKFFKILIITMISIATFSVLVFIFHKNLLISEFKNWTRK